jgi:hypothetical protein
LKLNENHLLFAGAEMEVLASLASTYPRATYIAGWTCAEFVLCIVLWAVCANTSTFKSKPLVAAFMLAHQFPIVGLCYYALIGRLDWIMEQPATLKERMYGFDPAAEHICMIQVALQIFVTTIAFATRDGGLLKPELLAHHSVTATLMCICLHPFGHSRVGIFFGLTELSTIPLNVMDVFKNFPDLVKSFPVLDVVCKISFALSFLVLRVGLVTKVSYDFQVDLYELYATGTAHSVPAVFFMSLSNIFVVGLQLYWSTLIIKGLYGLAFGKAPKKAKAT